MTPIEILRPLGDKPPCATLYYGEDCRKTLRALPERSVHCVVTSPPYWGLRDYGTGGAQIGLEKTPDEFVAQLVEVFQEVRRVLRDDGTLWLNLGDSYANDNKWGVTTGLKTKDLVGVPWKVAFALQADGWYLRSDIVWHKPNCMPESVQDRPTKAHEYLFLLTKQSRYFYDTDAIREPLVMAPQRRLKPRSGPRYEAMREDKKYTYDLSEEPVQQGPSNGRNKRTVWSINPRPYKGAHFATFPPELAEPCILAGTSERGCCPECGAPWARVVESCCT